MTLSLPSACSLEKCLWKVLHFIPLCLLCFASGWWHSPRVGRGAFSVVFMKPQYWWALRWVFWCGLHICSWASYRCNTGSWHSQELSFFSYVLLPPVNEFPESPQALPYCLSFMWSLEEMEALSLYRDLTALPSITEHPWEVSQDSSDIPIFWSPWRKTVQIWVPQGPSYSCHLTLYLEWLIKTSGLILLISYLKASVPDKQMVSCHCFCLFM